MAQDSMAAGQQFEIGRVLSTSFAVFFRNIVAFAVITFVIGIPYILVSLWSASSVQDIQAAAQTGQLPSGFFGMVAIGGIIYLLTNTLSQAAITYGTVMDLRGQQASFGDCLGRGLSMLPKVIGAGFLASIGIAVGGMLLVIPGIILLLMWWVLVPAIVLESVGVFDSFGRSRALTSGHRWGILGLLFIVGILQWLVMLVVGVVGSVLGPLLAEILNVIVALAFTAFASVLAAVGYYYLRVEKEGIVIDDIARVFD